MDFVEIAKKRQSCRKYNPERAIDEDRLYRILSAAQLSPSACNGQPYEVTVCLGEVANAVERATQGMGMNKFATDAPVAIVISEKPYVATAAFGAKVKNNDYRSIDIGILAAYITAAAADEGVDSCILGWLDDSKIRDICNLDGAVRLVITLGYAAEGDTLREKKRKSFDELFKILK